MKNLQAVFNKSVSVQFWKFEKVYHIFKIMEKIFAEITTSSFVYLYDFHELFNIARLRFLRLTFLTNSFWSKMWGLTRYYSRSGIFLILF